MILLSLKLLCVALELYLMIKYKAPWKGLPPCEIESIRLADVLKICT